MDLQSLFYIRCKSPFLNLLQVGNSLIGPVSKLKGEVLLPSKISGSVHEAKSSPRVKIVDRSPLRFI